MPVFALERVKVVEGGGELRKAAIIGAAAIVVLVFVIIKSIESRFPQGDPTKKSELVTPPRPGLQHFSGQLSHTVLVIGHRGNPTEAPENTLAAINHAFAIGAGMVEVDVHLSSDRVPVVIPDETVDRTTNGKGRVSQMAVAQLKTLDAGSWKDPKYANERIPTLAEALQAAKGKGLLLLDLKVDEMGHPIADVIRSLNLPNSSVAVGTWSSEQRDDIVKYLPGALVLCTADAPKSWKPNYFTEQLARGISGFEVGANWSPEFVAAAHAYGLPVYAYTINDGPIMRKLIEMGVDGIETDDPAVLIFLLNKINRQG
jgi:glycerophosphoryl diester phosphodiesterase